MKIAIISDVHNNLINLKKVLNYCTENKIENIICCGDLASMETLDFLNDNFSGEIYFSFGNMDDDFLKNYNFLNNQYKKTQIFKDEGIAEFDGKKIAFVHYPQAAIELSYCNKFDFIFYGHTHKPWEQIIGSTKLLNPGNVAGEIYPATFAVWDTESGKFELVRINSLN
jgi:uncharacterized protein